MRLQLRPLALAAASLALLATPAAAKTIKIGLIAPFSGPASLIGTEWKQGAAAFFKLHGQTVGGDKVEIVMRDLPGPNPLQARALAQELVIKEGVQYLAGLAYSPNALALGAFAEKAHVPIVIWNAAASDIIDKSKYFLRVSYTLPQVAIPEAVYARNRGFKKMVTMVSDYSPGWDGEKYFSEAFEKNGGKIVGKIRMPLGATDYVPYLQRARGMKPDAIFGFLPGGGPSFQFLTAYNNSGMRKAGFTYLGQSETAEEYMPSYGDIVEGLITVAPYSTDHKSKENDALKAALHTLFPDKIPGWGHVQAYNGMTVIYHMIEATHGKKDGDAAMAAARGFAWNSPSGPVKIDAKTRDFIENVYVRRVVKDKKTGKLVNHEFAVFRMQPDYGRAGTPIPTTATLKSDSMD
jgi:branched-chain amino acid transport system substrate-binding protein